jgi:hypothetical protein
MKCALCERLRVAVLDTIRTWRAPLIDLRRVAGCESRKKPAQQEHQNTSNNPTIPGAIKIYLRHWPPLSSWLKAKIVHRVRKFVEVGSGRIGYAMTEAALSEVSNGAEWNPDPSFSVADALLADPDFASVLRVVLRDGHVMLSGVRAKK